ncbi:MAG: hypothetical protein PHO10_02025 [Gemmiger sp.]|nr:hypothetical protein [Gemmiger sp.]
MVKRLGVLPTFYRLGQRGKGGVLHKGIQAFLVKLFIVQKAGHRPGDIRAVGF